MADSKQPRKPAVPSELDYAANGRDELNLAEFPISVLQWKQPKDKDGRKLDTIVYEATAYNPVARRVIPQRVTLTSPTKIGLPTPADEVVILALLCVAKHMHDFAEPRVHFSPHQLFRIIGWSPNPESYDRLATALMRYKALTILYENAWWDANPRQYKSRFMTGIIAEAKIEPTRGRLKAGEQPPSYVHWTPFFYQSLASGNLKKLDLDRLFSLRLPISQRMYRFLDKRFYTQPVVDMDLQDFAFGHIGLTRTHNIAEVKRRLTPAILELEEDGLIAPASAQERYAKIRRGIWRVRFTPGEKRRAAAKGSAEKPDVSPETPRASSTSPASPEEALVVAWYRAWVPENPPQIPDHALAHARQLIEQHGAELTQAWLPTVIKRMRKKFPDAKHFGASLSYFAEVAQEHAERQEHQQRLQQEAAQRRADQEQAKQQHASEQAFIAQWQSVWEGLTEEQRDSIRTAVLAANPGFNASPKLRQSHLVTRLCLQELATRSEASQNHVADGPQTA